MFNLKYVLYRISLYFLSSFDSRTFSRAWHRYMFSRAWNRRHFFPAWNRWHDFFPRLESVVCFPALGIGGMMFSRVWNQWYVFSRLHPIMESEAWVTSVNGSQSPFTFLFSPHLHLLYRLWNWFLWDLSLLCLSATDQCSEFCILRCIKRTRTRWGFC